MNNVILSAQQMRDVDAATIASGMPGIQLMENAGAAVARAVLYRYEPEPVLVLCGGGNNGGDGFVVARLLQEAGWQVTVALLGEKAKLQGDAAIAASRYHGEIKTFSNDLLASRPLLIDALFGTGLTREVEGEAKHVINSVNNAHLRVVSIDIPSGIDSDSGQVMGAAVKAEITIALAAKKPSHLLMPGCEYAGEVRVVDIGIPSSILCASAPVAIENDPENWMPAFPWKKSSDHKYDHGHLVVAGGDRSHTGAARLAATAALRSGTGLVTIACDESSLPVYAASLMSVMISTDAFPSLLADIRKNVFLIGPATGVGRSTKDKVLAVLQAKKPVVLDADALTSFADKPTELFSAVSSPCTLTPHDGEFARLFGGLISVPSKLLRAKQAAALSKSVIVLKGADTIIAAPDGRAVINNHASPVLAVAGSGDVLSGLCAGLLAQGMDAFEAACASVWLHGEASLRIGVGLIAEDLLFMLPLVLRDIKELGGYGGGSGERR